MKKKLFSQIFSKLVHHPVNKLLLFFLERIFFKSLEWIKYKNDNNSNWIEKTYYLNGKVIKVEEREIEYY